VRIKLDQCIDARIYHSGPGSFSREESKGLIKFSNDKIGYFKPIRQTNYRSNAQTKLEQEKVKKQHSNLKDPRK